MSTNKLTRLNPTVGGDTYNQCAYLIENSEVMSGISTYVDVTTPTVKVYMFPEQHQPDNQCITLSQEIDCVIENVRYFIIRMITPPLTLQQSLFEPRVPT